MVKKAAIFFIIVLSLIILVFLFSSCTGNKKVKDTVVETTTENTAETTASTVEDTPSSSIEVASPEETSDHGITDETIAEVESDVLKFKGNKVNENTAVMILEVNTENGEIAGVFQMGFTGFDMDMNSTKICDYVLTGRINGNLDTETLGITGLLEGRSETDTVSQDCNDYNVSYEMFAVISEDFSRIKGYFDTRTMDDYEFLLKPVTD